MTSRIGESAIPDSEGCVFCKIVMGTAPAEIVNESEAAITIVPLKPVTEGHLLVIPRQHARYIWKLDPNDLGYTMYDVASMAYDAQPCNIIQSNGVAASQTIGHVHFHVVPRRGGDGLQLPWPQQTERPVGAIPRGPSD